IWSMSLKTAPKDRPQGHRRLRFSLSSSLVKEHASVRMPYRKISFRSLSGLEGLRPVGGAVWPAVDEPHIGRFDFWVKKKFEVFSKSSFLLKSTCIRTKKYRLQKMSFSAPLLSGTK
ncbi:hypothetical protein, partial [Microvirga subterranea]|uniref:hypothetical protein n=1 Tax=Microvirga subterranea TaxID=186651 RepID=UPI001473543A